MTLSSAASLFTALFLLAAVPAPSVYIVMAKTSSTGFKSALVFIAGLVTGDLLFILFALYGLNTVATSYEIVFSLIQYLGGIYLCWLGYMIWAHRKNRHQIQKAQPSTLWSSTIAGLLITLSDPRAIIFYVSLLPAFVDVTTLKIGEASMIMFIAILSVGGAKLLYALAALKLNSLSLNNNYRRIIDNLAAIVMGTTGLYLILR